MPLNPGLVIVKELEILGASGALRSWVADVLSLRDASRAHDRLERKQVAGRLVLEPVH